MSLGSNLNPVSVLSSEGIADTALAAASAAAPGAGAAVASGARPVVIELARVTVGANGTIDLVAIAAATAGSIYTASIAATRLA